MLNIEQIIADAGNHIGKVIRAMYDGVALPKHSDTRMYEVFSHEGDEIGQFTTADVEYAVSFMKKRGILVGKTHGTQNMPVPGGPVIHYIGRQPIDLRVAYSFAWSGWHHLDRRATV